MTELTDDQWELFLSQQPSPHILQSSSWGDLKSGFGWNVERVVAGGLGAQVLFRSIVPGVTMAYIPRGPVGLRDLQDSGWRAFMSEVDRICRSRHAFLLKIEPDAWADEAFRDDGRQRSLIPSEPIFAAGCPDQFQSSQTSIQPARTILIDISSAEDVILSRMKQKTRYNIRLAQRSEVKVSSSGDLTLFEEMMQETGKRDQFGVHSLAYYQRCYQLFQPLGQSELFVASYQGEPLAMLMVFAYKGRAWYFYGASRNAHREKMPTYLLQWEAICWAKNKQCRTYDLWGIPDESEEVLEAEFSQRAVGLWGVYRFKRGFGGAIFRSAGPWDRVYNPILYRFYQLWTNRAKRVKP